MMRSERRRRAVLVCEVLVVLLLAFSVAQRIAAGAPLALEHVLVAATAVAAALGLGQAIWLWPLPDTAALRAAPPTALGIPHRTAGHARGPLAELAGALAVPALLTAAAGLAAALSAFAPLLQGTALGAAWTARLLFLLALVSLAPGLPFDGGRALRAAVWWWTGDLAAATRLAAAAGQGLGALAAAAGLAVALAGDPVVGAGLALAGLVVSDGAAEGAAAVSAVEAVRGRLMGNALIQPPCTVGRGTSLTEALERRRALGGPLVFPVLDGERFVGALTVRRALATPAGRRPEIDAEAAMIARSDLRCAAPGDPLTDALAWPARRQGYLPVLEGDRLLGIVLPDGAWPLEVAPMEGKRRGGDRPQGAPKQDAA